MSGTILPGEAHRYYDAGVEAARLSAGTSRLELARTQEIVTRYLPAPPGVVLDVGGGPGVYACWLARAGYEVHLLDAVPLHVVQARAASAAQPEHPLASLNVGDARRLERDDASVDAVLLLGPLYHLTERDDRLTALREARRVLHPGGYLFAAAIGRWTSALDGMFHGLIDDPAFGSILERDLAEGQHRNQTDNPVYFTTTYFHRPEELAGELAEAGFAVEPVLPVEGPAWLLPDFGARWNDPARRAALLDLVRALESEPALLGTSAHLLAVGRKPGSDRI
ncbi:MAG TPA: methyltransferase domain-containing protein [Thermomicrobiaceae bacterium]|nr:methyltransferase domain-containing protein [Thermomicrobiaceae bacterium]